MAQSASVNIATRGLISGESDIIATAGKIIRQTYEWREIIYLIYSTNNTLCTEVALTSSLNTEVALTSSLNTEVALTSSLNTEIVLTSSIQKTISISATIITRSAP